MLYTLFSTTVALILSSCGGSGSAGIHDNNSTDVALNAFSKKTLLPFYDHEHDTEIWVTDGTEKGTSLVKEINPQSRSSRVWYLKKVGDKIYFQADDGRTGLELWVTGGTAESTQMLKDIAEGHTSSSPRGFVGDKNRFYFQASDGMHGVELWMSDGTAEGTHLVKDIRKNGNSNPSSFTYMGDKVYFTAYDGIHGTELWASDGTAEGTHLVKDINGNSGTSVYRLGVVLHRKLYFAANDGTHGTELWVSDGTAEGTRMLKDINPGADSSNCYGMVQLGTFFYFSAKDTNYKKKLWKSDGTTDGTKLFQDKDGYTIEDPSYLTLIDQKLYFTAKDSHGILGLWVSDGSTQGTYLLKDTGKSYDFTVSGEYLYFSAEGDGSYGRELWRTDGTPDGTQMVKDINPGADSSAPAYLSTAEEGKIYFRADDGTHGMELWISDGTVPGTRMVKDIRAGEWGSYIQFMEVINNKVYFSANTDKHRGQLWVSDGTAEGTHILKLQEEGTAGISPYHFGDLYYSRLGGKHYFSTFLYDEERSGSLKGYALWKSDGTTEGTEIIAEHENNNPFSKNFFSLKTVNGKILMFGHDADHGRELWISDGSQEGTHLLKDIYEGKGQSTLSSFVTMGEKLYFSARDKTHGKELWVSDATESGTHMVKDIDPGAYSSSPASLTVLDDLLYFIASQSREIWMSDGTEKGTHKLIDNSVLEGQTITVLKSAGDSLWIGTKDKHKVYSLWALHKGEDTVVKIMDNTSEFYYGKVVTLEDKIFFFTEPGKTPLKATEEKRNIFELWSNDGTAEGSRKLKTFQDCSRVRIEQTTLSDKFFLYEVGSNHGAGGLNIWASDGTKENTKRIVKSAKGGYISGAIDDELLLNVYQKESIGLYRTDGTIEGTKLIKSSRW